MTDEKPKRGRGRPRLERPTTPTERAQAARAGTVARRVYLDPAQDERLQRLMEDGGHASASALVEAAVAALK